jgi:Family of unknown function (DUF6221)
MDETDEIAAFYAARLGEEEARAGGQPPVVVVGEADLGATDGRTGRPLRGAVCGYAWDPDRFQRDVASKRAILADCVKAIGPERERRYSGSAPYNAPHANLAFRTLRSLAFAYDGHPDYKETWKP